MRKTIAIMMLLFSSSSSFAVTPTQVTNKEEINKILSTIPVTDKDMNYQNLGERLSNIGMTVSDILVYKIKVKSDIESNEERIGDVFIQIHTSNPSEVLTQHYCNMLGSPTYLKRGGRFIPQDRTAVWLMTSKCELPK